MIRFAGQATRTALLAAIVAGASSCTAAPRIDTASGLLAELQRAGVAIDAQSPAPKPQGQYFRFDEGVRATGPGLLLDVLRIEDRRVFDIAKSAGNLLVVAEASAGQEIPGSPVVYARYPFVVVIREQPPGADIEARLAKLLPPERE